MKKVFLFCILSIFLLAGSTVFGASSWKNCRYDSSLSKGILKARGCGNGSWGKKWVEVARNVSTFKEAATSVGPVYAFKQGNSWRIVMLKWNTGGKVRSWGSSKPIQILRAGKFGVIIKSGNQCYDFNQSNIRPIKCK